MVRAPKFSHLLLSMSVLTLAACGGSHGVEGSKTSAPKPPVTAVTTDPDAKNQSPVVLTSIDESTDPVLVPMNAVLPQSLSSEDRLARLEQAVASLRTDYDTIMPAFAQLNVTNTRVQALLDQIEADRTGAPVPVAKTTPAATTTVTKVTSSSTAPIATTGSSQVLKVEETEIVTTETVAVAAPATHAGKVQAVRLGEHPGKTRIVVDLTGVTNISPAFDLDNAEHLLVIDLPGVSAQGVSASLPKSSGIVTGMSASETATGSNLVVQLKGDAKVLLKEYVKAQGKQPAKLVFDVGAAS